ncbi:hypothetical protein ACQPW1_30405 [Nocardia sp. CA-128927]|uniref:hypothetical protein n=1 Tax=Nocardia sp. CA-128927 TaxID=3239975 RepID=UPI003D981A4C
MHILVVRRGIAAAGIAGAAALALATPAVATAQPLSPTSTVAQSLHPGIALMDNPGDEGSPRGSVGNSGDEGSPRGSVGNPGGGGSPGGGGPGH